MGFELYLGDCRDFWERLRRRKIAAAILDPPYGINENAKKVASRSHNGVKAIDYGEFNWDDKPARPEDIQTIRDITKWQIIWGGNYYALPPTSCWLVWDKQNSGDFADFEMAWTNLPYANRFFRHRWNGMIRASEQNKRVHPSQKPVALARFCIEQIKMLPPGSTILDPYMGSSPVGIAALQMGHNYIGIERDPRYFEIAQARLEDTERALNGLPRLFKGNDADLEDAPLFDLEVA